MDAKDGSLALPNLLQTKTLTKGNKINHISKSCIMTHEKDSQDQNYERQNALGGNKRLIKIEKTLGDIINHMQIHTNPHHSIC